MDPSINQGLHDSKLDTILSSQHMPAHPPPSYHMVVDPNAPIPNLRSPYDPEDDEKDDEDELPEVTINATTQIRGHGNIISVPPMDAVRIAGLLHTMMYGPPGQSSQSGLHSPNEARAGRTKGIPKMNVTVNCGATVFGDRNVVGPALGDIARQMQMARNQQTQAQGNIRPGTQHQPCPAVPPPISVLTPMRSRTSSECGESDASSTGSKRKAGDDVEGSPEPKRPSVHDYGC
jgi:cytochrome c551/c552